eukprot:5232401-Pleurochrysis_carterae.AAC.1
MREDFVELKGRLVHLEASLRGEGESNALFSSQRRRGQNGTMGVRRMASSGLQGVRAKRASKRACACRLPDRWR